MSSFLGNLFSCNFGGKDTLADDIKDIKNNHLYHIEKDIDTIKTDIKLMDASLSELKINVLILVNK